MFVCKSCGQSYRENPGTCTVCSGEVIETTGAANYTEPVAGPNYSSQQPFSPFTTQPQTPVQPVYYTPVTGSTTSSGISGGTRAKGIVGLVLGIEGIIGSSFFLLYSFLIDYFIDLGISTENYYSYGYDYGYSGGREFFAVYFMIFALAQFAAGVVGMILSNKARSGGFVAKLTTSGKVLNLLTVIFSSVAVLINIMTLAA